MGSKTMLFFFLPVVLMVQQNAYRLGFWFSIPCWYFDFIWILLSRNFILKLCRVVHWCTSLESYTKKILLVLYIKCSGSNFRTPNLLRQKEVWRALGLVGLHWAGCLKGWGPKPRMRNPISMKIGSPHNLTGIVWSTERPNPWFWSREWPSRPVSSVVLPKGMKLNWKPSPLTRPTSRQASQFDGPMTPSPWGRGESFHISSYSSLSNSK